MSVRERFQTAVGAPEDEGAMDVWEGSDVPGVAGQRTRFESWDVIDEMNDDHFHKFVREQAGDLNGRCLRGGVKVQYVVNLGFAAVPDDADEEVQPFAT